MTEPVTHADEPAPMPADGALHLRQEVSEFERLRERAHEQIAALAVTIDQLERLRSDINNHLPRSRPQPAAPTGDTPARRSGETNLTSP